MIAKHEPIVKGVTMTSQRAMFFGTLALSYGLALPARADAAASALTLPLVPADAAPVAQSTTPDDAPPRFVSPPRQLPILAKLGASFTYEWALNESFFSGGLDLQIGAQGRLVSGGGRAMLRGGRTLAGLPFLWFSVAGGELEFRVTDRLRLGLGGSLGYLMIFRATKRTTMDTVTFTAYGEGTLDLYRPPTGGALYLGLRVGLDCLLNVYDELPVAPLLGFGPGYRF